MKKRLIAIMMVVVMMLSSIPAVFAENDKNVSKVTFKGLSTTQYVVSLGGIRLYSNNVLIESGAMLSSNGVSAESEKFIVSATSQYAVDEPDYYAGNPIDTSKPQTGLYADKGSWISSNMTNTNQEYSVTLKTPQPLSKIEFITNIEQEIFITDQPFVIEITYDDNTVESHDITPSLEELKIQALILKDSSLAININSGLYDIYEGETFTMDISLSNADNVTAEDFTLQYDATYFELVSEELIDSNKSILHHNGKITGEARYIVSSNGNGNELNGDASILRVTMKAKSTLGSSDITFKNALVATSAGVELTPAITPKTFNIIEKQGDVNGDDAITLADLAIASKLLNTTSSEWGSFTPDIDGNGTVELADLTIITTSITK